MGPVISTQSKARIESLIQKGLDEGGRLVVDGRGARIPGGENGYFLRPTLLSDLPRGGLLASTEIFGPVLGVMNVANVDEAIALVNSGEYGNMACVFTSSGQAARRFRYEAQAGNIGINIGVPAPMAFFPFSGWKNSFFGTLHAQGDHAVEFFTQTKVVVERWLGEWNRKF
jgi:malonate-semialdehyde dehydrogenase (acetylating)/methylmalonate-semialdehyde dehydrogenase